MGAITILRRKRFCLTVPKNFVGELFNVPLFFGIDNIYASGGYVIVFCRKFFVSQCRKKIVGELFFVSQIFGYRKKLKIMEKKEGSIRRFRRKFFVSLCRKIS